MTVTLLAVDDSKTMRQVLEITFAGDDHKIVLASTADEALRLLPQLSPSAALIDAKLGTDSGYELCRKLKEAAPNVPVLLLTSRHAPFDKALGADVGVDDHMDKPFDTQQLIDRVGAVISQGSRAVTAKATTAPFASPLESRPRSATLAYGSPGGPAVPPPRNELLVPVPSAPVTHESTARGPLTSASQAPATVAPGTARGMGPGRPEAPAIPPKPAAAEPAAVAARAATPAPVVAAATAALPAQLENLGLSAAQVEAVMALSREVVERVVWEVVPVLAETMIREEIARLTAE